MYKSLQIMYNFQGKGNKQYIWQVANCKVPHKKFFVVKYIKSVHTSYTKHLKVP